MEKTKKVTMDGVGIGSVLPPGSYKVDGEVLLLRVRLDGLPLVCLIDQDRRVREILSVAAEVDDMQPKNLGEVAYDGRHSSESPPCPQQAADLQKHAGTVRLLVEKFSALLQRYAADGRACLRKMAPVLDRGNASALQVRRAAPPAESYLVASCSSHGSRGSRFKVFCCSAVSSPWAAAAEQAPGAMSLDQQKNLLREFVVPERGRPPAHPFHVKSISSTRAVRQPQPRQRGYSSSRS
jgi:hypothetical protein